LLREEIRGAPDVGVVDHRTRLITPSKGSVHSGPSFLTLMSAVLTQQAASLVEPPVPSG
jgi:hypothetical protein